ncbi:hypothetical protein [Maritalea mediterranea]|uniref:Uncharacterized protein n=1 Tax=Maritalea mediterranea TaxID=2909667 RepID=A0ABS9E9W5_9HYPH|nr:hypothetical protein [Maritalea mediterranea]MCF4098992.1 hypothetical protein [Maritalea mediterranea]
MYKILKLLVTLVVMTYASPALAGMTVTLPPPTFSPVDDTSASIGLRFEFGDIISPSLVGAVRTTHTSTENVVTGGMVDIAIPIGPDLNFQPTIRLMGIFGNTQIQGLAGAGFDFGQNQGILALGTQIKHLEGGMHIGLEGGLFPYVGASSYGGPPERETSSPPPPD